MIWHFIYLRIYLFKNFGARTK